MLSYESENSSKMERDEFDDAARHFTIKSDGVDVGCFRVIQNGSTYLKKYISSDGICEISRFIILPEYRHPALLCNVIHKLIESDERLGLTPAYMIIKKSLARFAWISGVKIVKASPYFDLNGARAVYLFDKAKSIENHTQAS
jgi:N-acyl-L-homoserine lactone synthetase